MEKEVFHITVKNVESGEVVMDRDSAAFICIAANEENTQVLTSLNGDAILVGRLLWRAQEEINRLLQAHQLDEVPGARVNAVEGKQEGLVHRRVSVPGAPIIRACAEQGRR